MEDRYYCCTGCHLSNFIFETDIAGVCRSICTLVHSMFDVKEVRKESSVQFLFYDM